MRAIAARARADAARELLLGAGATVDIADNGRIAVEKLRAAGPEAYDAVLMDLQMPGMDGLEATRLIRSEARFASLPIVAMTAHAMAEEREKCIAAGMVDHIAKPVDPEAMLQTVARWVRAALRPQASPAAPEPVAPAADLPAVEGLDAASGLRRVAGNRKLYVDLLRQFAERQADAAQRLAAALAAKDAAEAERIAHSVKGVAGNIGLTGLQSMAAALETAVRAKKGLKAAATKFEAELARVVSALQAALAPAPSAESAPSADTAAADEHADAIKRLLETSDGAALDYLSVHRNALRAVFRRGGFDGFERAVGQFDFEDALRRLRETRV